MDCNQVDSAAADGMESVNTEQLGLGNALPDEDMEWVEQCMAKEGENVFDTLPPVDRISEEYVNSVKQLRHQPIDVAIERLFIQGGFKKFTEVYGEHDGFYFQNLCTSWDSVEDYKWIEALYVGRFVLTLPHPAHAAFLFQLPNDGPNPVVPESKNAWAVAKRCGLDPVILDMSCVVRTMQRLCPKDGAIFHGNVPLYQFHETRSAEGWNHFSKGLIFLCIWWHQTEAPWLEGLTMQAATVALAKEEERIAYRNSEDCGVVLNTVKSFFEKYGSQIEYSERPEIIRKFVQLVTHYPNMKWRLSRILHDATVKAGFPIERIEVLRSGYGHKQYTQQYFAWKRSLANESDQDKKLRAKMGERLLLPFRHDL